MKSLKTTLAVLVAAAAILTSIPAEAHSRYKRHHHRGSNSAIVTGLAAGAIGAMLFSNSSIRGSGYNGYDRYDRRYDNRSYAPRARFARGERVVDVYRSRRSGERICETNFGRVGLC